MTEAELNQLQAKGLTNLLPDETPPAQPVKQAPELAPFLAALEALRLPKQHLAAAPGFVPQNSVEQLQVLDDGVSKKLAVYINGEWVTFNTSSGGLARVAEGTIAGTTELDLTDLNGDADAMYQLVFRAVFSNVSSAYFYLRLNGDADDNYHQTLHRHGVSSNSDIHAHSTSEAETDNKTDRIPLFDGEFKSAVVNLLISSVGGTGSVRQVQGTVSAYKDKDTWVNNHVFGVWDNITDELTSIKLVSQQNYMEPSRYWLYKLT